MDETDRLIRIREIISNKKKGEKGLLPICASSFWDGVKSGRYPQPIKLSERTTCWRLSDIMALVEGSGICQADKRSAAR